MRLQIAAAILLACVSARAADRLTDAPFATRSEVYAVLDQSRNRSWPVPVSIGDSGKELVIETADGEADEATLWVMPILDQVSVKIERGEMAGREVVYVNVVRKLVPAAMWTGPATRVALPKDGLLTPDATGCVALLQKGKLGTYVVMRSVDASALDRFLDALNKLIAAE